MTGGAAEVPRTVPIWLILNAACRSEGSERDRFARLTDNYSVATPVDWKHGERLFPDQEFVACYQITIPASLLRCRKGRTAEVDLMQRALVLATVALLFPVNTFAFSLWRNTPLTDFEKDQLYLGKFPGFLFNKLRK